MKFNFIVLCDKAFISREDNKLNIIGIFDMVNSEGFPAIQKEMCVVAGIDVDQGDYDEILTIKKENTQTFRLVTSFRKPSPGKHQFIHNLVNTNFFEPGDYTVEIQIINSRNIVLSDFTIFRVNRIQNQNISSA